jgi:hypothetical protein
VGPPAGVWYIWGYMDRSVKTTRQARQNHSTSTARQSIDNTSKKLGYKYPPEKFIGMRWRRSFQFNATLKLLILERKLNFLEFSGFLEKIQMKDSFAPKV